MALTDAHPPLGKYIIAAGIQLSEWWNSSPKIVTVRGVDLSPFGYRQANALIGSLIPLTVIGIARTLTLPSSSTIKIEKSRSFALLGGAFVAIDGLFVTESRYALLNVHVVFLGLLSHWFWLKAATLSKRPFSTKREKISRWLRVASGCCLGGAIATKWNGLGYFLSLIVWEIERLRDRTENSHLSSLQSLPVKNVLKNLALLAIAATITYSLIWWPHLHITQENIFSVHADLFHFHQQLSADGHAACSRWYSWPLLIRPITYWYSTAGTQAYTVSNLGNPALWLFSSSAILLLTLRYILTAKRSLSSRSQQITNIKRRNTDLTSYLVISYVCNWLPWMFVRRCTFNYLYMPAAVFSFMALACLLSTWLASANKASKAISWLILVLITISLLFWSPLAFGWPLSFEQLQKRWLLKSWI